MRSIRVKKQPSGLFLANREEALADEVKRAKRDSESHHLHHVVSRAVLTNGLYLPLRRSLVAHVEPLRHHLGPAIDGHSAVVAQRIAQPRVQSLDPVVGGGGNRAGRGKLGAGEREQLAGVVQLLRVAVRLAEPLLPSPFRVVGLALLARC